MIGESVGPFEGAHDVLRGAMAIPHALGTG